MGYAATTGAILYCKPGQTCVIRRSHHAWFDEYTSCLSIEYKHTPFSLLLQEYPEIVIHNLDPLNLIPCEIDLTSTPSSDTKTVTYEIEVTPAGKYLVSIHWIINILQSLMSLIQYQIHQPFIKFQHRLNKISGSLLSMDKILLNIKVSLI